MASSKDYLQLHFIVFLWGFSAILGKLVTLPAVEMVWYRSLLAALGMAAVIYFSRRSTASEAPVLDSTPISEGTHPGTFKVASADLIKLLAIGGIVSIHWISFFGSARVANVSVSLVGFATNSLWTAVLEPWFKRTRIKKYELVLGMIVLSGLYIIFSFDFQYKLGLLLGIFAGFTSALFAIFNSQMVKRIPSRTITFYEMIGAGIATGLFLPFFSFYGMEIKFPILPSAMDLLYIAVLAGVCSVYAYAVAVELMKRVSVFMIQLTLNLEPVYGIIMAVIIFGEREKMNLNFYAGTLVILGAVITYPFMKKRFDRTVLID
jgi:drug/metabolite transporter (DMT)-like permease